MESGTTQPQATWKTYTQVNDFDEDRPLRVCRSGAGFYIGTLNEDGLPYERYSARYWPVPDEALQALQSGKWIPKI